MGKERHKKGVVKQRISSGKIENWFSAVFTHVGAKKKYVWPILKYKAHISKYVPCIFSLLPEWDKILNFSFHFDEKNTDKKQTRFMALPRRCVCAAADPADTGVYAA